MLKLIVGSISILLVLIGIIKLDEKCNLFERISNRVKDKRDIRRYKKERNTILNMHDTLKDKYANVMETNSEALQKILDDYKEKVELKEKINKLKEENKELRRTINEDMVPKKKRGKKSEKN